MAIKTSTFSGWYLTGEDADQFRRQINDPTPNLLAREAIRRGEGLAKEYAEKGYATIRPMKKLTSKKGT